MILIRLKGGLGNQMFQYAFARGMSKRLNTEFKMDCSLLLDRARAEQVVYRDYDLDIFKLKTHFIVHSWILRVIYKFPFTATGRIVRKLVSLKKSYQKEKHFHFDKDLIENPKNSALYDGWWQSRRYWENVENELRKELDFVHPILESSLPLLESIKSTNSVCLNVRRTDFVNNPTLNATNLQYFQKAVDKIASLVKNPHFFIFSDDLEWCKNHLVFEYPSEIISHNEKGKKFGNYLRLMSSCKHFIIPNSSFAWWAVWLSNKSSQHVIAPENWFNDGDFDTSDLIPSNWIRI